MAEWTEAPLSPPVAHTGRFWWADWLLRDSNPRSCGWESDALTLRPSQPDFHSNQHLLQYFTFLNMWPYGEIISKRSSVFIFFYFTLFLYIPCGCFYKSYCLQIWNFNLKWNKDSNLISGRPRGLNDLLDLLLHETNIRFHGTKGQTDGCRISCKGNGNIAKVTCRQRVFLKFGRSPEKVIANIPRLPYFP